jgi:hypothetical protein
VSGIHLGQNDPHPPAEDDSSPLIQVQVSTQDVANEAVLSASTETSRCSAILPPTSKREGSICLLGRTDVTARATILRETMSGIPGTLRVGSRSATSYLAIIAGSLYLGFRTRLPALSADSCKKISDVICNLHWTILAPVGVDSLQAQ